MNGLWGGPSRARTRPGGAVVAWRQSARKPEAAFTQMLLGDLDPTRLEACVTRLKALGAPAIGEAGPALETVHRAVASVWLQDASLAPERAAVRRRGR